MEVSGYCEKKKKIKCVVWDLDNTLWDGVLLEDSQVKVRQQVIDIIKMLDERGILQSIASKNNYDDAVNKLSEFGIDDYFLYPQISWNSKSSSIRSISQQMNISLDTFAFIDDQQFELDEVKYSIPEVRCYDISSLDMLLDMSALMPNFITEDSKNRRRMYLDDQKRKKAESEFVGPQEEFLASLKMTLSIAPVGEGDLQRAEELTIRTNQLNTTGYTYSYAELDNLRKSDRHKLLIASLDDMYGSYGKIGLTLVECNEKIWTIKLLLMSCRVMSRGVGTIMLNHIMNLAVKQNCSLRAEFVENTRNRMMYITYKFADFKEILNSGDTIILESKRNTTQNFPEYINVYTFD